MTQLCSGKMAALDSLRLINASESARLISCGAVFGVCGAVLFGVNGDVLFLSSIYI